MAEQMVVEFWETGQRDMQHWQHYAIGSTIPRVGDEIIYCATRVGTVDRVQIDMTRHIPSVSLWITTK